MSFLGGIGSLLTQPGIAAIGAGLLSGVVAGGALVSTGVFSGGTTSESPTLALLACPDSAERVGQITDGQSLLVTGRSEDGTWLEVYVGQPGIDRGWAPASALQLESTADELPVVDCAGPSPAPGGSPEESVEATAVVEPSPEPSEPTTESPTPGPTPSPTPRVTPSPTPRVTAAPTKTPSPTPTKTPKPPTPPPPTPTPVPTPTPDTTGPTISNLTISGALTCGPPYEGPPPQFCIFPNPPCGAEFNSATISISATDPSGVIDANLWYRFGTSGGYSAVAMNNNGNTWSGTISAGQHSAAIIEYFWEAFDSFGNQSNLNYTSDRILRVEGCLL